MPGETNPTEPDDAARGADATRDEALGRLGAAVAKMTDEEVMRRADAAREAYQKVREEGRTAPEGVVTVRPLNLWTCACGEFDDMEGGEIRHGDGGYHHQGICSTTEDEIKRMLRAAPLTLRIEGTMDDETVKRVTDMLTGKAEPEPDPILEMSTPDDPTANRMYETGGPSAGKELAARRPGGALEKWADVAMWSAPAHEDPQHPIVTITMAPDDPLGIMAMVNGMYTGKVYSSPAQVSDEERRDAWEAFAVSRLSETPAEWVQLSILFENVTRAFTHQLVRTRTATYAQESLRFAVKEDMGDAVKLPPSLAGTSGGQPLGAEDSAVEWMRNVWDQAVKAVEEAYLHLVDAGMPAEDARGLLPTNVLTRVHDRLDIKALLGVAGMRLCTQAQFEWREVFAKLVQALREYLPEDHPNRWQYELMAERFRPVCFAAGKCTMKARSDRHCSIRAQVDAFEAAGVPSSEWESRGRVLEHGMTSIEPEQWLADPAAARVRP